MRDTSSKFETLRAAVAEATLTLGPQLQKEVAKGNFPKGDPFPIARAAGIMAAKKTSELIPYCHPVPVDWVEVSFEKGDREIRVRAEVKGLARTGLEMEALTAASLAALTLYDMLKPIGGEMGVSLRLVEKKGGKSAYAAPPPEGLQAALLVFSDSVASHQKEDKAGKIARELLKEHGVRVSSYKVLPDEKEMIVAEVKRLCDRRKVGLLVTTGGTGASARDVAPEAIAPLLEKRFPGIEEAVRAYGFRRTPYATLSRCLAGVRGETLILALPGSSRGVQETLEFLLPWVFHLYRPLRMERHD